MAPARSDSDEFQNGGEPWTVRILRVQRYSIFLKGKC